MDINTLKTLAQELAKGIKTPSDLNAFSAQLTKLVLEAALNAELTEHLGYPAHVIEGLNEGNSLNGSTPKKLKGDHGEIIVNTPRDRDGSFEPLLIKKAKRVLRIWMSKF